MKPDLRILFIGDIFGEPGVKTVQNVLPKLLKEEKIDFVIAQGENITGRKGLSWDDYKLLKEAGVNCFTMGNHVWANNEILNFIENEPIIRPYNIKNSYPGKGTLIFNINNFSLRVTSLMGISFNELLKPWKEQYAEPFIQHIDNLLENEEQTDFHFIDFHAETTSEKYVLGLHLDGRVDAVCGTHTHVQTNDAHVLPNGTCFITDVGMVGPMDSAIGVRVDEVKQKMIDNSSRKKFVVSENNTQFNSVIIDFFKQGLKNKKNIIKPLNFFNCLNK
ncbi:TIGR00282 family metallophosphoesterase [Mycoplasma leonicaptivi]|uniref:TIGR00282 family metallophosphoesterase n=1 Tax=Mycoplasma leonicaptivi TaxID=36742 RepID=UPI000482D630|nr:TIGR00282 family metallophosphoesterase [Mycoplasma leonicaptivi]